MTTETILRWPIKYVLIEPDAWKAVDVRASNPL